MQNYENFKCEKIHCCQQVRVYLRGEKNKNKNNKERVLYIDDRSRRRGEEEGLKVNRSLEKKRSQNLVDDRIFSVCGGGEGFL